MSISFERRRWLAGLVGTIVLGGGLWAAGLFSNSSQYVIGVVNNAAVTDPGLEGLRFGLRDLGYVEGRDFRILYDGPTGSVDRLEAQAQRWVDQDADLLFAMTTPSTAAAIKASADKHLPVVFAPSANPIEAGFVDSYDRPGGRITGVTFGLQEEKRLEWFVRIVPGLKKVLYPYNPNDTSPAVTLEILRRTAPALGVEIVPVEVFNERDLRTVMQNLPSDLSGIFVPPDAMVASHVLLITSIASRKGLPVAAPERGGVLEGALMSYGFSEYHLGIQAAGLLDKIMKGAEPASLPVLNADFELSINVRTARSLLLNIPDAILNQAILVGG